MATTNTSAGIKVIIGGGVAGGASCAARTVAGGMLAHTNLAAF